MEKPQIALAYYSGLANLIDALKHGKKIKRGIYRIESEPKDTGE